MQFTHLANPVPVHATTILEISNIPFPEGSGASSPKLMLRLGDGRNYEASIELTARYIPVVGDYLVTQEDGYEYLNPKEVFERKYRPIPIDTRPVIDDPMADDSVDYDKP